MPASRARAFVTLPDVAEPADTGRRVRSRATLAGLAAHFDLDVVVTGAYDAEPGAPVQTLGAIKRWIGLPVARPRKAKALGTAVLRHMPIELCNESWAPARRALRDWPLAPAYDFAWFGAMSHFVGLEDLVRRRRTIIDFDDLQTAKWSRFLASTGWSPRTAPTRVRRIVEREAWHRAEVTLATRVDAVVTADPDDVQRCQELGIPGAATVPNSYPDPGRRPHAPARTPTIAFVANFAYGPNLDAARELISDVLPALRRGLPGSTLRLIGPGSQAVVARSADQEGVEATGRVPEVAPLLQGCLATLMPIRSGGGTRVKAMEAFALGVPVVGTAFAVTGLDAVDGVHCLLADTPDQFVQATLRLARDAGFRAGLQEAARNLYEQRFVPAATERAIAALVERVADLPSALQREREAGHHARH